MVIGNYGMNFRPGPKWLWTHINLRKKTFFLNIILPPLPLLSDLGSGRPDIPGQMDAVFGDAALGARLGFDRQLLAQLRRLDGSFEAAYAGAAGCRSSRPFGQDRIYDLQGNQ